VIRCEHCGSMLPDGAIFCGECGRAVTAAASRRPVAPPPVEQAPPPPLQQPDLHGRRQDPAADAWLPEATLDPATRAWLTGADRRDVQPPAPVPVQRPDDHAPRSAPTHVHGSDSGLRDWSAQQNDGDAGATATEPRFEPTLDPNAYPDESEDPETTRLAERSAADAPAPARAVDESDGVDSEVVPGPAAAGPDAVPERAHESEPDAAPPVWSPPQEQAPAAPAAGPSWWVGRSTAAVEQDGPAVSGSSAATQYDEPAGVVEPPRPGDTAVVEPLVDRRVSRPAPLVTPGSQATTCHVCGHRLEPDDIFCGECGAVRPAVTAAFTGQIVPLPMDRPDWAADDSVVEPAGRSDAPESAEDAHKDAGAADADVSTEGHGDLSATAAADGDAESADEDTPRAPLRTRGAHALPVSDEPAAAEPAEAPTDDERDDVIPEIPLAPGSATVPSSAPTADDTAALRIPSAAPLPPVPGSAGVTGPVLSLPAPTDDEGPTSADGDLDDDDVDETRIVSKTPTHAPFVLHFSTGERFGVHGTGLVGRLPRPQPGERFDDLLTVHDPGKSVSKTHLELGRDGDDLWVSDRFSGNGTVVRHIDGSIRRCEPGRRYRVERGARVDIGEQFFLVQ